MTLAVLVAVATVTLLRPTLGATSDLRWEGNGHRWVAAGIGLAIGLYDGLLGPGTGTFLVISLVMGLMRRGRARV